MTTAAGKRPAVPSLADYLQRYDLAATLQQAQLEYERPGAVAPRLLEQSEITARFRKHAAKHRAK